MRFLRGKSLPCGESKASAAKLGLTVPEITEPGTIVPVAMEGRYAGYLPVSYTHLDVYKRQGYCCSNSIQPGNHTEGEAAATP